MKRVALVTYEKKTKKIEKFLSIENGFHENLSYRFHQWGNTEKI